MRPSTPITVAVAVSLKRSFPALHVKIQVSPISRTPEVVPVSPDVGVTGTVQPVSLTRTDESVAVSTVTEYS